MTALWTVVLLLAVLFNSSIVVNSKDCNNLSALNTTEEVIKARCTSLTSSGKDFTLIFTNLNEELFNFKLSEEDLDRESDEESAEDESDDECGITHDYGLPWSQNVKSMDGVNIRIKGTKLYKIDFCSLKSYNGKTIEITNNGELMRVSFGSESSTKFEVEHLTVANNAGKSFKYVEITAKTFSIENLEVSNNTHLMYISLEEKTGSSLKKMNVTGNHKIKAVALSKTSLENVEMTVKDNPIMECHTIDLLKNYAGETSVIQECFKGCLEFTARNSTEDVFEKMCYALESPNEDFAMNVTRLNQNKFIIWAGEVDSIQSVTIMINSNVDLEDDVQFDFLTNFAGRKLEIYGSIPGIYFPKMERFSVKDVLIKNSGLKALEFKDIAKKFEIDELTISNNPNLESVRLAKEVEDPSSKIQTIKITENDNLIYFNASSKMKNVEIITKKNPNMDCDVIKGLQAIASNNKTIEECQAYCQTLTSQNTTEQVFAANCSIVKSARKDNFVLAVNNKTNLNTFLEWISHTAKKIYVPVCIENTHLRALDLTNSSVKSILIEDSFIVRNNYYMEVIKLLSEKVSISQLEITGNYHLSHLKFVNDICDDKNMQENSKWNISQNHLLRKLEITSGCGAIFVEDNNSLEKVQIIGRQTTSIKEKIEVFRAKQLSISRNLKMHTIELVFKNEKHLFIITKDLEIVNNAALEKVDFSKSSRIFLPEAARITDNKRLKEIIFKPQMLRFYVNDMKISNNSQLEEVFLPISVEKAFTFTNLVLYRNLKLHTLHLPDSFPKQWAHGKINVTIRYCPSLENMNEIKERSSKRSDFKKANECIFSIPVTYLEELDPCIIVDGSLELNAGIPGKTDCEMTEIRGNLRLNDVDIGKTTCFLNAQILGEISSTNCHFDYSYFPKAARHAALLPCQIMSAANPDPIGTTAPIISDGSLDGKNGKVKQSNSSAKQESSMKIIVGITAGAVVLLLVIGAAGFFIIRNKKKATTRNEKPLEPSDSEA